MTITAVLPSYYFAPYAEVLVTSCGHRHVRESGAFKVGDNLICPWCEEDKDPAEVTQDAGRANG